MLSGKRGPPQGGVGGCHADSESKTCALSDRGLGQLVVAADSSGGLRQNLEVADYRVLRHRVALECAAGRLAKIRPNISLNFSDAFENVLDLQQVRFQRLTDSRRT